MRRLALERVQLLPTKDPHAGGREDVDGLVGLIEPEDDDGVLPRRLDEGVHVLDTESCGTQGSKDTRQTTRSVRHLQGDDLGLPDAEPMILEGLLSLIDLIHDQAQDAEVGRVRQRERTDIDAGFGQNARYLGQAARLILQEFSRKIEICSARIAILPPPVSLRYSHMNP